MTASTEDLDALFATTLTGAYDDEAPWQAVQTLRRMGSREVFNRANNWLDQANPLARARAADVLAQLGRTWEHPTNNFAEESYALISDLARCETDPRPLGSAISALGHIGNPLAVPLIAEFVSHPNPEVRFQVSFALGCFPNEDGSIKALLELTEDSDEDVRDWATFGLGVLSDADSVQIREALLRRLKDSNPNVCGEALAALGKRRDGRAIPCLIETLERTDCQNCVIEAASSC